MSRDVYSLCLIFNTSAYYEAPFVSSGAPIIAVLAIQTSSKSCFFQQLFKLVRKKRRKQSSSTAMESRKVTALVFGMS
jgi:hypothetical protein